MGHIENQCLKNFNVYWVIIYKISSEYLNFIHIFIEKNFKHFLINKMCTNGYKGQKLALKKTNFLSIYIK